MKFIPVTPDASISDFVNKFVIVQSDPSFTDTFYSEVVPTGYNYFNLGKAERTVYHHPDRSVELEGACYVNGHLKDSSVNVEVKGPFTIVNCEMHPTGLYYLFGQPAKKFTDKYIPLEEVISTDEANAYVKRWLALENVEDSIPLVTEFISGRTRGQRADHYVDQCVAEVRRKKGQVTVEELCDLSGVGRRQLEKKFREMTGLSPGHYSGTIQFIETLKIMEKKPGILLQDLAYQAGYYDLPHLMNTFKKYAGAWPSEYSILKKKYVEEIIK